MASAHADQPPRPAQAPPPPMALPDLPPISSLFLIEFDVKAGYTILWRQALPRLEVEGVVEYKSLPSGLHTVAEDLVYFVHDSGHAGLSAFVNRPTDEDARRHARMIAVGVLVPLSYGRLGRAWRHAEGLKAMAAKLAADTQQTKLLEEYWESNKAEGTASPSRDTPLSSPSFAQKAFPAKRIDARTRSTSDRAPLLPPGHKLSPLHPAWSLTSLLDTFGPLIFPIHRAALLRRRILISTHAPVHEVCNFVYDISILSNIPMSVYDLIDPAASAQRLRPLFTIGIHDIPYLLEQQAASRRTAQDDRDEATLVEDPGTGWVACTTDSILAMKADLWDVLITMPPSYSTNAKEKVWPTVEGPRGVPIKATQRDLRRFRSLRLGLGRIAALSAALGSNSTGSSGEASATRCGTSADTEPSQQPRHGLFANEADTDKIVESTTWGSLAYNGFMWWASAGEQRHGGDGDEAVQDASLLADLAPPSMSAARQRRRTSSAGPSVSINQVYSTSSIAAMVDSVNSLTARDMPRIDDGQDEVVKSEGEEDEVRVELAVIAYFHRLTTSILGVLAGVVENTDEDDMGDGDVSDGAEDTALMRDSAEDEVRIDNNDLARMGLDVWSRADAAFVKEMAVRYYGRRACIELKGVEVCGLRVC